MLEGLFQPMHLLVIFGIVLLVTVLKTLFTVRTSSAGIVERFGKFNRIVRPGLHVLIPYAERVFIVDLQVKQAQFQVETKTRDNVFVQIPVSVQYQVLDDKIFDSFYKLSSPQKQIESFVFNSSMPLLIPSRRPQKKSRSTPYIPL